MKKKRREVRREGLGNQGNGGIFTNSEIRQGTFLSLPLAFFVHDLSLLFRTICPTPFHPPPSQQQ